MLPLLEAERQLLAIEAAVVPHLKPEDAQKLVSRHTRALKPKEERPQRITEAFLKSGLSVIEVPTRKPSSKRRDTLGHDEQRRRGNR